MKENPRFKGVLIDENDNPIPDTEFTGWYSRSVAVTVIICDKTHTHFLVEKRGPGCPDNIGKWCLCCGYVNWDEWVGEVPEDEKHSDKVSLDESAATREVYEETGLRISPNDLRFFGVNGSPFANRQNITIHYIYDKLTTDELRSLITDGTINSDTVSRGGETGECDEIKLMSYSECLQSEFAFNHKKLIENVVHFG